nr:adenosylcobinamide amidohydrolase [Methylorubrum extorquens]
MAFALPRRAVPRASDQLSWSMPWSSFQLCRKVAWLEVRNADLPPGLDPFALPEERVVAAAHGDAVALTTSRDVRHHHLGRVQCGEIAATCLATVGLSNPVRVGRPRGAAALLGTINLLVHVLCALSQAAPIETISIATQTRTAAILALDLRIEGTAVSGTGTGCIVVAVPASLCDLVRRGRQVWRVELPPRAPHQSGSCVRFLHTFASLTNCSTIVRK